MNEQFKRWNIPRGTTISESPNGEFYHCADFDTLAQRLQEAERDAKIGAELIAEQVFADHSAQDLNMVQVPRDLHLITLGMLSSYVTTLAGIDFPDNDDGDHQQRLNETKRAAVNSAIAKLRALITGSTA